MTIQPPNMIGEQPVLCHGEPAIEHDGIKSNEAALQRPLAKPKGAKGGALLTTYVKPTQ